jgi:hypothetical protein
MPEVERHGIGPVEVAEVASHLVHYAEGLAGLHVAATPLGAALVAGGGAALSIFGVVHQVQNAHAEGRGIGQAAQHGAAFVRQLGERAGLGDFTPRTPEETRGAAAADRCWLGLRPSDRVALTSEGAGRIFVALDQAVLRRAQGQ